MARKLYGGRWQVIRSLGEGGQGRAFWVHDLTGEWAEPLVLKQLKNAKRLGRFAREIETLQRLKSPYIPAVIDYRVEEDAAYLVTQFAGTDLVTLRSSQSLDFLNRISLFKDVVRGVAAAHEAGVVHRDLKPNNIVVLDGHASVIDFGICQEIDGDLVLTTTDEAFGNAAFAAPECFLGSEAAIGPRSDVYSLGKLWLWLVTPGRFMPREDLTNALVSAIDHNDPWVRAYSAALTHQAVKQRQLADADELLIALEEVAAGVLRHIDGNQDSHAVWDSTGPHGTGYSHGSRSASGPHSSYPGSPNEVAQGFQFVDPYGTSELRALRLLVRHASDESGVIVRLLADDNGPDEGSVLWSGRPAHRVHGENLELSVEPSGVQLLAGATYWVCLSVAAGSGDVPWITGWLGWEPVAKSIFPALGMRNLLAERQSRLEWKVANPTGAGKALVVETTRPNDPT